jgi:hypothetical protein
MGGQSTFLPVIALSDLAFSEIQHALGNNLLGYLNQSMTDILYDVGDKMGQLPPRLRP